MIKELYAGTIILLLVGAQAIGIKYLNMPPNNGWWIGVGLAQIIFGTFFTSKKTQ